MFDEQDCSSSPQIFDFTLVFAFQNPCFTSVFAFQNPCFDLEDSLKLGDVYPQHTSVTSSLFLMYWKWNRESICKQNKEGFQNFCLYTKDLVVVRDERVIPGLYQRAMELNFLQGDTRGGCLSVRELPHREIMFSYTDQVPEISARDFSNILFLEKVVSWGAFVLLVSFTCYS